MCEVGLGQRERCTEVSTMDLVRYGTVQDMKFVSTVGKEWYEIHIYIAVKCIVCP